MQRRIPIIRVVAFALLALTLFSDIQAAAPAVSSPATLQYHAAIRLLDAGRDYETAAALLKSAIAADPDNPAYHVALADTFADRASSIACALTYRRILAMSLAQYPQDLADWKKAQLDTSSDDYGMPKPVPPTKREFATKDDGKPLVLTDAQAEARIAQLATRAQAEWRNAIDLSPAKKSKASAEESYAWGLRLFERCYESNPCLPAGSQLQPLHHSGAEIVRALESATRDDPSKSAYWAALGDQLSSTVTGALSSVTIDDPRSTDNSDASADPLSTAKPLKSPAPVSSALAAYRRALDLCSDNPGLWARVAALTWTADPHSSIDSLRSAIEESPDSGRLHYDLATLILSQTPYGDILNTENPDTWAAVAESSQAATDADAHNGRLALQEIERGNKCEQYAGPEYATNAPPEIASSWRIWSQAAHDDNVELVKLGRMRMLAREASGFAFVMAYRHRMPDSVRALSAVIAAGDKMTANWQAQVSQHGQMGCVQPLVGLAVAGIANHCLLAIGAHVGDSGVVHRAKIIQAELTYQKSTVEKQTAPVLFAQDLNRNLLDSY